LASAGSLILVLTSADQTFQSTTLNNSREIKCAEKTSQNGMEPGAWAHAIVEHILTVSALTPKQVHTIRTVILMKVMQLTVATDGHC
jgi:hypothetical protein